jgi:hypothetical protein
MKTLHACIIFSLTLITGCASSLKTYDGQKQSSVGVPVATPVLVKITEITTYKSIDNQKEHAKYCTPETVVRFDYLALGERSYITFEPAPFGKAEFALEYNESGSLKSVSLGSDASAGVEKVNELVSTVLPYVASTKFASADQTKLLAGTDQKLFGAPLEKTAQEMKDKFCLLEGKTVSAAKYQVE